MMEIHRLPWGLGPDLSRETRDADFGAPLLAASISEEIELGLEELGYRQTHQWRYERNVQDIPGDVRGRPPRYVATVDLVQVRAVALDSSPTVEAGSGDLDPVAIVETLSRPAVAVHLELTRRNGRSHSVTVNVADEVSAIIMKAYAWRARRSSRDVHDLWRCLVIAHAAGSQGDDFLAPAAKTAAGIISEALTIHLATPFRVSRLVRESRRT